jgi:hypothetical protein
MERRLHLPSGSASTTRSMQQQSAILKLPNELMWKILRHTQMFDDDTKALRENMAEDVVTSQDGVLSLASSCWVRLIRSHEHI